MTYRIACSFQTRMYADDTSLTFASTDVNHLNNCLNYDLSKAYTWLSANKLTLNLTKTEFMLIASRQEVIEYFRETLSNYK